MQVKAIHRVIDRLVQRRLVAMGSPCLLLLLSLTLLSGCGSEITAPEGEVAPEAEVTSDTGFTFEVFGEVARASCAEVECQELDGNPCTEPWCDPKTGACGEERPLPDGSEPLDSYCWEAVVCFGGLLDEDTAVPTALHDECAAQNDALDPAGCVDQVVCVNSEPECVVHYREEGIQCWTGDNGEGIVCPGSSCSVDGDCVLDDSFTVECDEDSWPDDCGDSCRDCTTLSCHWIDDPANPGAAKQVKYCKAAFTMDAACDDGNPCTTDDFCVLASQSDGLLGKETLGECQPGPGKTLEDCLEEMGMADLPCLLAGVSCDVAEGCSFEQDAADAWCLPPDQVCYVLEQTYCTQVDVGDGNWNAETGCHLVTFDAAECDDGNPCTDDGCSGSECTYSNV